MICPNCKEQTENPQRFQDLLICDTCFRMVSHYVKKAQTEMQMIFLTYTDMLRVSLVRGELRPPQLPPDAKKGMPRQELAEALYKGAQHAQAKGNREVHPLQDGASDRVRQTRSGGDHPPISGGRSIREVPTVQERGLADIGSAG